MVKTKAKRGFTANRQKKPKGTIAKKTAAVPKDPVEALIMQSKTALSMDEKAESQAKQKAKKKLQHAKARHSVVRKQQKKKQAGAMKKQRRKGIN